MPAISRAIALRARKNVEQDAGIRAEFRMQWLRAAGGQDPGDLLVAPAAKDARLRQAGLHAGRPPTAQDPVQTEPALARHALVLIIDAGTVRAGDDTILEPTRVFSFTRTVPFGCA